MVSRRPVFPSIICLTSPTSPSLKQSPVNYKLYRIIICHNYKVKKYAWSIKFMKVTLIENHFKVKRIFRPVKKSFDGEPLLVQTKTASGLLLCVVVSFLSMHSHFTCYVILTKVDNASRNTCF